MRLLKALYPYAKFQNCPEFLENWPSVSDKQKVTRVDVYWHTVRYRTVILYIVVLTTIALTAIYLVFPEMSGNFLRRISEIIGPRPSEVATISARQARFVNLDGKVQVKKANSVQWASADYSMTLDKGDLIQTGSEGVARIAFADGTTYTVKGDTLVTVEENLVAQNQPSEVAVHITSGSRCSGYVRPSARSRNAPDWPRVSESW